ncbi:unnamed protein product [Acanthosepion pharaonis]|uniref:Uncharacterized protein n=1 Tax=Acanthosepion pharaonis TaxID=158019 RepID=A0A812EMY8_ACAPH|nr:unnamed protein product [Sepia pharaonis]
MGKVARNANITSLVLSLSFLFVSDLFTTSLPPSLPSLSPSLSLSLSLSLSFLFWFLFSFLILYFIIVFSLSPTSPSFLSDYFPIFLILITRFHKRYIIPFSFLFFPRLLFHPLFFPSLSSLTPSLSLSLSLSLYFSFLFIPLFCTSLDFYHNVLQYSALSHSGYDKLISLFLIIRDIILSNPTGFIHDDETRSLGQS